MNAIEIQGLTKRYGDFTLDGLSLELPAGCILGLIGENGAGKTTAMRLMLGMTKPDGGTASVLGTDIGADLSAVKEELGGVPDITGRRSPHVLRHTIATELLNGGSDLNAIKEMLGHSSLAATQVYTHNSVERLKAEYEKAHPRAKDPSGE